MNTTDMPEGFRMVTNDDIIMTRVNYMKLCLYSMIGCILCAIGGAMIAVTVK